MIAMTHRTGAVPYNGRMNKARTMTPTIHEFTLPSLTGGALRLAVYDGQVMLLVDAASECGFTPHYAGLKKFCASEKP